MRGKKELPDLHAVLNELDDTAGGIVDGVAPTDIKFLFRVNQNGSKACPLTTVCSTHEWKKNQLMENEPRGDVRTGDKHP